MKWRRLPAAVVLIGLLSAPVFGEPRAALQVIPGDAVAYALLNNPEQLNTKIQALAKQAGSPLPLSPFGFVKTLIGVDKGIDDKGTMAVAIMDVGDDEEPVAILCIPVTSYDDVLAGLGIKDKKDISEAEVLGKSVVIGRKGDFALVAESHNKEHLQKALAAKKSIAPTADRLESYLSENDLVAVVTTNGIKKLCEKAKEGLDEAKNQALVQPPFVGDYMDWIQSFVKQAETEVPNLAFGLRIDAAHNVSLGMRVQFKEGGEYAKIGPGLDPLKDGPLAGLPAGPYAFAFGGLYPEKFLKGMLEMNTQMLKSLDQLDKKDVEKLGKAYEMTAKGIRGMGMSLGSGGEGKTFMENLHVVAKVADADEYISNYVRAMEVTGEIYKKVEGLPFPATKAKSIKVGEAAGAEVEMDLSSLQGVGENEKRILDKLFGNDGKLQVTMAAADKSTVLVRYTAAKALAKTLESYREDKRGLQGNADIAKTASLLQERAQWVMYLAPKGTVDLVKRVVDDFAPGVVQVPEFPSTPPIGIGAEMAPTGFDLKIVVPASVIEGIGRFVKEIQKQQGFL